jgi:hypothetical protein
LTSATVDPLFWINMKSAHLTLLALSVITAGCTRTTSDVAGDQALVGIGNHICMDTLHERVALDCAHGRAHRAGIALFVQARGGELRFVDDTAGEAPGGFAYVGTIGDTALHVVQSNGHESYPVWILVDPRTRKSVALTEWPAFSSDGAYFATGGSYWDNCSEADGTTIEVWHFTRSVPVLEWREATQDCLHGSSAGWGATHLVWHGRDTIDFDRIEWDTAATPPARRTRRARAVRTLNGWRLQSNKP